jgi:hypothetical protein
MDHAFWLDHPGCKSANDLLGDYATRLFSLLGYGPLYHLNSASSYYSPPRKVSTFSSPQAILGIMPAGGNETKQIDRVFMSSRKYSQVASSVTDFQEAGKGMLMCNINHLSQKLTFYGN